MSKIGLIDVNRLVNIPVSKHADHEFCFYLIDLMTGLLVEVESSKSGWVSFELSSKEEAQLLESSADPFSFLEQSGRSEEEKRLALNQLSIALYADALHYLHEGMRALEKRKFSVALTLLRKPLKENLLFTAWICADEEDFFIKFKENPKIYFDNQSVGPDKKLEIIESAIEKMKVSYFLDSKYIYESIFDRKNDFGLAGLFDKATHLVTKNNNLATEEYNLNFIFKNPMDNDLYDNIYVIFANLLIFMNFVQIEIYNRMDYKNYKYINWLIFISVGVYQCLFVKGKSKIINFINSAFEEFLYCPFCESMIKLYKKDGPKFLIKEELICNKCKKTHHFPFNWLWGKVDIDLRDVRD